MINIIHVDIHYNDQRKITAIETKLKAIKNGDILHGHPLVATVSAAFFKTTLLTDAGESLSTTMDPKRNEDVVDLMVNLRIDNDLSLADVASFIDAFQQALDNTTLF